MFSFTSNDSVDSAKSITKVHPEILQQTGKCVLNGLKYNNPMTSLANTIKIVNETPGAKFELPSTKYKIRNFVSPAFDFKMYYECGKCQNYTGVPSNERDGVLMCVHCDDTIIEKKPNNFFVYIPLLQQLRASIKNNWDLVLRYKAERRDENFIADVCDGSVFKKIDKEFSNFFNLSLLLNTDGAQVHDSAKKSLWPLQIIQNYLPPHLRNISSNILVVGLNYGAKKPVPKHFFSLSLKSSSKYTKMVAFVLKTATSILSFGHSSLTVYVTYQLRQWFKDSNSSMGYLHVVSACTLVSKLKLRKAENIVKR